MGLENNVYAQYLYKYKSEEDFKRMYLALESVGIGNNFYIKNLEMESDEDTYAEISAILAAERTRIYSQSDPGFFLNIFKINKSQYIVILSVLESIVEDDKDALDNYCMKLFGEHYDNAIQWGKKSTDLSIASRNFWTSKFSCINPENHLTCPRSVNSISIDSFIMDDKITDKFNKFIREGNNPNALCAVSVGKLVSFIHNDKKAIINTVTNGRPLPGAPIFIHKGLNLRSEYEDVLSQNREINNNSACSKGDLYKIIGNRFMSRILATEYYVSEDTFVEMFHEMRAGALYCQPAVDTIQTPLTVLFRYFNGTLSFTYAYDSVVLGEYPIDKIHDTLTRIFDSYLMMDTINEISDFKDRTLDKIENEAKKPENNAENRVEQIKIKLLRNHPITAGFTEADVVDFSKKFSIIHRNMKQSVLIQGDEINKIYIVCAGRIEVQAKNRELFFNPLYIAGNKTVFGIESLTDTPISPATYMAYTDDLIVLAVDKDEFVKESYKYPSMFKYVLSEQSNLLHKFENLWVNA